MTTVKLNMRLYMDDGRVANSRNASRRRILARCMRGNWQSAYIVADYYNGELNIGSNQFICRNMDDVHVALNTATEGELLEYLS